MSWEEMSRTKRPCPCGKGYIESVDLADDWNRSETCEMMHCEACERKYSYEFVSEYARATGKGDGMAWVKKPTQRER